MLFLYLARMRADGTGETELENNVSRLKTKEWPYAVAELYLGKRSPAATLDAAAKAWQKCEAHFYVGQWHVLRGNATDAEPALRAAVETCPKTFILFTVAISELKRIKP